MAAQAMVEVIKGSLLWAPEVEVKQLPPDLGTFALEDGAADPLLRGGAYSVPHYGRDSLGGAFGPLSLDQTLRFCQLLRQRLPAVKGGPEVAPEGEPTMAVAVCTPPGDQAARTNTAVLLGAFLVICYGWSPDMVEERLGADAQLRFVCSWARGAAATEPGELRVRDCWAGLRLALDRSWLSPAVVDGPEPCAAAREHRTLEQVYDAAWLAPGRVIVSADPVTTVTDPDPLACKQLWPSAGDTAPADGAPLDWVTWASRQGVKTVVRANFGDECGLKEHGGTYDAQRLVKCGLAHVNLPVIDKHGGVPAAVFIGSLLKNCEKVEGAVLIHCKGGFGRSVIYACCLMIQEYDLPGRALLGWVRIARPGAITTPQQEQFLCNLQGRADLEAWLRRNGPAPPLECCTVS